MKIKWQYLAIAAAALLLAVAVVVIILLSSPKEEAGPRIVGVFMNDDRTDREKKTADLLTDRLEREGFAVKLYNAQGDQSKQNQQVEELLAQDVEAVLLCPVMPDSSAALVQQLKEKDVPLIFFGREPAREILDMWDKTVYVGCDPTETGVLQGQILLAQPQKCDINDDGKLSYILLRDSEECADTNRRAEGAQNTLKEETEIVELNDFCPGNTEEAAQEACEKLLANYGKDIEAVICTNDTVALGAVAAIKDGGRTVGKDIYLVGADGIEKALKQIQAGNITGTVLCDLETQVEKTVELLQTLVNQPAENKTHYVNHISITQENIAEYLK